MKPVSELLKRRDSSLFQVSPDATVFEGLQQLARHGVGAMLVMQGENLGLTFWFTGCRVSATSKPPRNPSQSMCGGPWMRELNLMKGSSSRVGIVNT